MATEQDKNKPNDKPNDDTPEIRKSGEQLHSEALGKAKDEPLKKDTPPQDDPSGKARPTDDPTVNATAGNAAGEQVNKPGMSNG